MVQEQLFLVSWASWGSIFAGGATALALSIVMALFGVALGFTVVAPKSNDPTSGLGVAFGLWSFLSVVVSIAGGGFIAGLFAGQRGLEHGFLVWAVVTIVATLFSGIAIGSAVLVIGSALKSLGSGAAGIAGAIGKGAAQAASAAIAELRDKVDLSLDIDSLGDNVAEVLRDTGIDTLQPEYLKEQMREARSNLRASLYQLSLAPADSDRIFAKVLETEKSRLESLTGDIDREAAVEALVNSRNIPREEAGQLVDNAVAAYKQSVQKVKGVLAEARVQVRDAQIYLKELADTARDKADKMASAAAKAALAAAAALILAAAISAAAGLCGASYAPTWDVVQKTYIIE